MAISLFGNLEWGVCLVVTQFMFQNLVIMTTEQSPLLPPGPFFTELLFPKTPNTGVLEWKANAFLCAVK